MNFSDKRQNRKLTEDREKNDVWRVNVRLFEPATILSREISYRFITWQLAVILN